MVQSSEGGRWMTEPCQCHNIWWVTQTFQLVRFQAKFKVRLWGGFERNFLKVNVLKLGRTGESARLLTLLSCELSIFSILPLWSKDQIRLGLSDGVQKQTKIIIL